MDKLTINGAVEFSFYDKEGRVLRVRCGYLDADHIEGWFALYVNNIEVFRTNQEPVSELSEWVRLGIVQYWGKEICLALLKQWQIEQERKHKGL